MNIKEFDSVLLESTDGPIKLGDFSERYVVIYFYPKDNTPGCAAEGLDFKLYYEDFLKENVQIFGVSKDKVSSHCNFRDKYEFPFILVSDENEYLCGLFDVIKEKSMYGKTYLGIERSTFVFDSKGELIKSWRKVKVKDHAEIVLKFIKEYQSEKDL